MHRTHYVLLLTMLLAGCSGGEAMFDVNGTVKYSDGDPVTGELATIVFQPDAASANIPAKSASGTINPDGSFTLMTSEPGDGAHAGDYKVILKVWADYRGQKLAVPERYSDVSQTPLRATVSRDSTEFEFLIDR